MDDKTILNKRVCAICGGGKPRSRMQNGHKQSYWYGKSLGTTLCGKCYCILRIHKKKDDAPQIKCACGCGSIISSIDTKGRPQTFKWGHHMVGKRGPTHPSWGGGRHKDKKDGYWRIWMPEHHYADKRGRVAEHRVIWEEHHNACLLPWADVHHKDGDKENNVWYNLEGMTHNQHFILTISERLKTRNDIDHDKT